MVFVLPDIDERDLIKGGIKPRLFISYSRANLSQVGPIVKRLEEAYYDPWFDTRDIAGGEDWKREIAKGIQNAQQVIFFMSPESCESEYCWGEIVHALKHGVRVLPVRINNKTPDDALDKVGLSGKQFVKWDSENEDVNWQRLLNDHSMVKPPLAREIRRLNPEYERLHRRYLNTFFRPEFSRMSLADISDESTVRGVPLTSVYVPLPVDLSYTIQVDKSNKKTITDWWVKVEKSETRADANIPDELREHKLREWITLRVDEKALRKVLAETERMLAERAEDDKAEFWSEQTWFMEAHDAANVQSRMVLTGNPGSGKSTFVKHLALCLAGDLLKDKSDANINALRFWTLPAYTPVFIRLVEIVKQEFPNREDKADTEDFEQYLKKQLGKWDIAAYWRDLQDQLYDGSAIILLDGLDEVPNAVEKWRREQIMDFVAAILNEYSQCRMIITSRPYAYNGDWKLDDFGQTTLKPLDWRRLSELAQALFSQLPEIQEPQAEADAFIKALRQNPRQDFWTNPLQFTMGATLWMRNRHKPVEQRVPPSQSELYDKSVALMLEKWARRDPTLGASVAELLHVTPAELRNGLERLALQMQSGYGSDDRATFDWTDLLKPIEECRRENTQERLPSIDYNLALDLLEQRAGLLTSEEGRVYRFQHLSYQEYLAACELAKPKYFPHAVTDKIISQPGRWRNVVPLLWDIIAQHSTGDLQMLVKALLPETDTTQLPSDDPLWEVIAQLSSLQAKHENLLAGEQRSRLSKHLASLIERGVLAPVERAEMGRILSTIDDPRSGVGTMTAQIDGKTAELPRLEWCDIPAPPDGVFIMGADNPRREVELKYGFKMGKYLVTYRQFQTFVDSGEYDQPEWWIGFPPQYQRQKMAGQNNPHLNHPRDNVSWYQAVAFTCWLTAKHRKAGLIGNESEIRLPREEEWEYAARGTDERTYPYLDEFNAAKGNTSETNIGKTSAVGIFPDGASPFGVLDMSGNVFEWCLNDYKNPEIVDGYSNGESKVLRGGSFGSPQISAAASYRYGAHPGSWNSYDGLRLVLAAPISAL